MSPPKKDPDWMNNPPLDANRSLLEQWEERLYQAESEEEFDRRLKWLEENIYQNRDVRSLLEDTRSLMIRRRPDETCISKSLPPILRQLDKNPPCYLTRSIQDCYIQTVRYANDCWILLISLLESLENVPLVLSIFRTGYTSCFCSAKGDNNVAWNRCQRSRRISFSG